MSQTLQIAFIWNFIYEKNNNKQNMQQLIEFYITKTWLSPLRFFIHATKQEKSEKTLSFTEKKQ